MCIPNFVTISLGGDEFTLRTNGLSSRRTGTSFWRCIDWDWRNRWAFSEKLDCFHVPRRFQSSKAYGGALLIGGRSGASQALNKPLNIVGHLFAGPSDQLPSPRSSSMPLAPTRY